MLAECAYTVDKEECECQRNGAKDLHLIDFLGDTLKVVFAVARKWFATSRTTGQR